MLLHLPLLHTVTIVLYFLTPSEPTFTPNTDSSTVPTQAPVPLPKVSTSDILITSTSFVVVLKPSTGAIRYITNYQFSTQVTCVCVCVFVCVCMYVCMFLSMLVLYTVMSRIKARAYVCISRIGIKAYIQDRLIFKLGLYDRLIRSTRSSIFPLLFQIGFYTGHYGMYVRMYVCMYVCMYGTQWPSGVKSLTLEVLMWVQIWFEPRGVLGQDTLSPCCLLSTKYKR